METEPLELLLLGPLEARVKGAPVGLGGPKQRALLAILALHANDVVPLDILVDELWDAPPRTAPAYVQNCVHRLRKVLGADALETRAPGYRLRIDPDSVDARRFERRVREARGMPTRERAAALREALGLWRGTPLSDLAYWDFAQDAIRNLEEQRVNALQLRLEADLELGLHREVIGELDALVHEHPTHERLRWLQLLALHRSDRRQDALAAYQEARLAIVEESGMEPGEELRALQRRILQDDPSLMPGGVAVSEPSEPRSGLMRRVVAVCIVELLVDDGLDLEAARGLVARGLATFEEILLRRRGTVEQLLGEEALAVFGLPAAGEDDPLRALRSAVELRDALGEPRLRAAVEWGEVLVDEDGRTISGGALTAARRLKEHAREGEILLGPAIAAHAADAVRTEPSDGHVRLVELIEGVPAIRRRPDAPLAGRRAELERLTLAVREAAASSACRRVVVLGDPGIGKTRLVAELVQVVGGEARVLTGRCVPYSEGATYLPLVELVAQIAGGEEIGPSLHALLDGEPEGEPAAARLADALSGAAAVDSGDVFWATRKLLETLARDRPLLVVLEDVHWAEPTLLDLLEYLVGWSTGAPIALVCLARTELLDARPAWAADAVVLRPLADEETAALFDALPEASALDADERAAVVAAAEGNPLFLEQVAAHALDGPLEPGRVPASLESLLASRLDSLEAGERVVLERAAVVGREFTRAAVDALAPDEARGSTSALLALVRRRLVRPNADFAVDDAFLFDHALIREATYGAVAKSERARLHERLARWLDRRGELDEVVGYHLEQACRHRRDAGDDPTALANEAAERLGRAGVRAAWSRDHRAAVQLLTRAVEQIPRTDPRRLELECLLSVQLRNLWEPERAAALLDSVERTAVEIGDRRLELRARVEQVWSLLGDASTDPDALLAIIDQAVDLCEAADDVVGGARAWHMRAVVESRAKARFGAAAAAAATAADHYARAGAPGLVDDLLINLMADGTTPVEDVIVACESWLASADSARANEGLMLSTLAVLKAWVGSLDGAAGLLERSRARLLEMGDDIAVATQWVWFAAEVAVLGRDPLRARELVEPTLAMSEARSDLRHETHLRCVLAEAALLEGDDIRARELAERARTTASRTDLFEALAWRLPLIRALSACGELDRAEHLADEAVTILDPTDHLLGRGRSRVARAEVRAAKGRTGAAVADAQQAVALFGAKGATLFADRASELLAGLQEGEPEARAPLEHA